MCVHTYVRTCVWVTHKRIIQYTYYALNYIVIVRHLPTSFVCTMHTFCNHTLYCVGQRRSPQHLSMGFIVCFLPLWPCSTVRFKAINCCSSTYRVCSHIFLCKLHLTSAYSTPSNVDCATIFVCMSVQTNVHIVFICVDACLHAALSNLTHYLLLP